MMIYSLTTDDIPSLSAWIKKSESKCFRIFWQRNRDSNPNKQSQSLSCYRYTIPLNATLLYTRKWELSSLFFEKIEKFFTLFILFILKNKKDRCEWLFRTDENIYLNYRSAAAALSRSSTQSAWFCRMEAGTCAVTSPLTVSWIACAFAGPVAIRTIFFAAIMEPTPMVSA